MLTSICQSEQSGQFGQSEQSKKTEQFWLLRQSAMFWQSEMEDHSEQQHGQSFWPGESVQ